MKKHLFYTFLGIFAATSVVTLLGIIGVLHISDGFLHWLVTAFLTELAVAVIALFTRTDFFTDDAKQSKITAEIQSQNAETIASLKQDSADVMARSSSRHKDEIAHLQQQIAHMQQSHERTMASSKETHADEIRRVKTAHAQDRQSFSQAQATYKDGISELNALVLQRTSERDEAIKQKNMTLYRLQDLSQRIGTPVAIKPVSGSARTKPNNV